MTAPTGGAAEDPFGLGRFVDAQAGHGPGDTYDEALAQLRRGRKTGHWVWYVLPQLALGATPVSLRYSLSGLDETRAYLAHPVLGPRLRECAQALLDLDGDDPVAVLGADAAKLRSCATLVEAATSDPLFTGLLERYFAGLRDEATLALLRP